MTSWLVLFEGQHKTQGAMEWGETFFGSKAHANVWAQMKVAIFREEFSYLKAFPDKIKEIDL